MLISKTLGAMKVEQFHHIVLGNFVFKIITKIIANRLGFIAAWIISPNQFGFIKGLQIQECKALASNWLNCLDKHSYCGNVGLKLDIRKTLDTMRWNFIISVLRVFGAFLNWVHNPFNSNWSSIVFNGSSVRLFCCSRGVWQGDPLSLLLFCIAEDVFSRLLSRIVQRR